MADAAPEVKQEECKCEPGAPKWVVTFGDMMSLLLCFFVLLLSFSTTDIIKYRKVVGSLKDAFGIAETTPSHMMPSGEKIIPQQIELPKTFAALVSVRAKASRLVKSDSQVEMESGADWVRIKVDGDALFDSGSFTIKQGAGPLLDQIGDLINDFEGTVMIEGHTDNDTPQDTRFDQVSYLGNYELGAMRSIAVLGYLMSQKQVAKDKLVPVTFGEMKPRETNDLTAGKAKNRRVEFEFRADSRDDNDGLNGEIIRPQR